MESKILFLGTGGDAFVIGKQKRASGGIIFNYAESQFHIDPGPGSLVMAKLTNANLRSNTGILVTGNDLFRANDVNAVIFAMTHDGLDKRGVLICPSKVILDEEKGNFANKFYLDFLERIIMTTNTKKIGVNEIDIEVIDLEEDNCGYKIITPKFSLVYIPHTLKVDELMQLEEIDILILNVRDPIETKNSLNSELAQKVISKLSPQIAIITGFGMKMLESESLYECREMQKNTGIQVISAKDGMNINPASFSAIVRQKKLHGVE